jgi:hypothetical protein
MVQIGEPGVKRERWLFSCSGQWWKTRYSTNGGPGDSELKEVVVGICPAQVSRLT